ncbi:hypothetical protein B0G38_002602 [Arthrobacter sp. VKM Ac-2550]|nr:hypothetical protein [Arthrobacter sp. VKM Ac-2550]
MLNVTVPGLLVDVVSFHREEIEGHEVARLPAHLNERREAGPCK